jgi:hypothetical protein
MSRDVWVYWESKKPTKTMIRDELATYVSGLAKQIVWSRGRFFVQLPGGPPRPRIGHDGPRWFEVYIAKGNIDVITREADEITNNIARGFAVLCARKMKGRIEEG